MKNILVPVDFSDVTERVISTAEEMARALGARVWVLHCLHEYPDYVSMGEVPTLLPVTEVPIKDRFPVERRQLDALVSGLNNRGISAERLFVVGIPFDEILAAANQYQADMIVMGSHGHGSIYELLVGTVTHTILRHTTRPILLVPSQTVKEAKTAEMSEPSHAILWDEPMATPY